ncbi:hypothetical protein M407DRAFT_26544 [Tulasnella calospora MUT 4182]|uniref:Uncharacterized protein n=1 Tax=Tulasnella calospora MUT 4182 TaxID=1051891 RepID=A0A0C3KRF0_9AGAM|nr:hypothetical protein M407DRAFT_26544 [Tulasnella calospora MUT 4182]
MSTSSAPPVERFKGTSWEECNEFILAIRARAFWEGKQRDPAWMADFAANYFWQKAMSWHCRLPQDVRQDWLQLEMALVDRWPPLEDDDDARIKPTPAAAPSLDRSSKADLPRQGILKLVLDESKTIYYLKLGFTHCFLTTNQDEAIRVRCDPVFGTILLEKIKFFLEPID